jgi:hypothetical protein
LANYNRERKQFISEKEVERKRKRKKVRKQSTRTKKGRRGRTEGYKKEDRNENKAAFIALGLLLRLCLVNYSKEREQDRTKKEVERKNRREKG